MTAVKNIVLQGKVANMHYEKINETLYNKIVHSHPSIEFPVEQSPVWSKFQNKIPGRHYIGTYLVTQDEQNIGLVSVLYFEMRGYSYVWINNGPIFLKKLSEHEEKEFIKTLTLLIKKEVSGSPLFVRYRSASKLTSRALPAFSKSILEKTTVVNLKQNFNDILAAMSQGARRGMRKAQKADIIIDEIPAQKVATDFEVHHAIMRETAGRDGFFAHPINTYTSMLETLGDHVRFFVALDKKKPIAWAIVTIYDNKGIYYYGASNKLARDNMAPYLLHIEIMKKLQEEGIESYDFLGIGSPNYPGLQGVTQFKLRFGGEVREYPPSYDLPLSPLYKVWKVAEKAKYSLRHSH
jgi:lipid II:glycine glycyltransferase (peptidoglycan interpeptide bridge formation enzyme)